MTDLRDSLTITATLYAIAAVAWLLAGCASVPAWQRVDAEMTCVEYAGAYARSLAQAGYECGTVDMALDSGDAHRMVWLRDSGRLIYLEPYTQTERMLSKREHQSLHNYIRRREIEPDIFAGKNAP